MPNIPATRLPDSIPLLQYVDFSKYRPAVGDFIIMSGWFRTKYGVVSAIAGNALTIIVENLPSLLLTLRPHECARHSIQLSMSDVQSAGFGKYAVLQYDNVNKTQIWYV